MRRSRPASAGPSLRRSRVRPLPASPVGDRRPLSAKRITPKSGVPRAEHRPPLRALDLAGFPERMPQARAELTALNAALDGALSTLRLRPEELETQLGMRGGGEQATSSRPPQVTSLFQDHNAVKADVVMAELLHQSTIKAKRMASVMHQRNTMLEEQLLETGAQLDSCHANAMRLADEVAGTNADLATAPLPHATVLQLKATIDRQQQQLVQVQEQLAREIQARRSLEEKLRLQHRRGALDASVAVAEVAHATSQAAGGPATATNAEKYKRSLDLVISRMHDLETDNNALKRHLAEAEVHRLQARAKRTEIAALHEQVLTLKSQVLDLEIALTEARRDTAFSFTKWRLLAALQRLEATQKRLEQQGHELTLARSVEWANMNKGSRRKGRGRRASTSRSSSPSNSASKGHNPDDGGGGGGPSPETPPYSATASPPQDGSVVEHGQLSTSAPCRDAAAPRAAPDAAGASTHPPPSVLAKYARVVPPTCSAPGEASLVEGALRRPESEEGAVSLPSSNPDRERTRLSFHRLNAAGTTPNGAACETREACVIGTKKGAVSL